MHFIFGTPALKSQVDPVAYEIRKECFAVGRALGYTEKDLPFDEAEVAYQNVVNMYLDPNDTSNAPSTFLDTEAGRPFEVEVIIGEVVRSAHRLGVAVPM